MTIINRQSGNILLSVMVISAIIMGIGSTLYNSYIVSEAEAVDKTLVDIRAYWAMTGHVNYMLGRVGFQGLCPTHVTDTTIDTALTNCSDSSSGDSEVGDDEDTNPPFPRSGVTTAVSTMQYYLDGVAALNAVELHDLDSHTITNPGARKWHYPVDAFTGNSEYGDYTLDIESIVRDLKAPGDTNSNDDRRMRIDLDVRSSSGAGVAGDAATRIGRLSIGFCVVDVTDSSIPADGAADPDTRNNCGTPPTTTSEGYNRIQFIQWNKPFS